MSWANLVKKTIPISSSSILTNSENNPQKVEAPHEPTSNHSEVRRHSRIRLASLKECLDYRHSGSPRANVYYSGISGKSQTSLSDFYRIYHRPLQWLYKNRIQSWCQEMGTQVPSLSSFIVLAWIFSD